MMRCIAVDDEKLVLELLADNIQQVPYLELVKTCKNAMEAIEVLQQEKIDLIFLDIQMPKLSGLQFLQTLQQPPMIILVTAYEKYALESYNFNVVDYLLKPVSFDRFLKACNKAHELFNLQNASLKQEEPADYFFVHVEYNLVKVVFSEIIYIEGMKDYIKIFITSSPKPVITKLSMKAMEEKLAGHKFMRIHKSYIVNADKITSIKRDLIVMDKIELPLSESYKPAVEKMLYLK